MSQIQLAKNARGLTMKDLLANDAYQKRFNELLKDKAPAFMTSLLNTAQHMPKCNPDSIIGAAMIAAAMNLPIDKNLGFAWLVPYKNEAQFQLGYKGMIQLAQRSGQYHRMNAKPVNQEVFGGYDEIGEPIIDWNKLNPAAEATGYVFAFRMTNGFTKVEYWSREQVEAHAQRYSQSFKQGNNSPWKTHFDEMALKTVIKNTLSKWGIMSIDMVKATQADQSVVHDIEGVSVSYPDNPEQSNAATTSAPELPPPSEPEPQKTTGKTGAAKKKTAKKPSAKPLNTQTSAQAAAGVDPPEQQQEAQPPAQEQEPPPPAPDPGTPADPQEPLPAPDEPENLIQSVRGKLEAAGRSEQDFVSFLVTMGFAENPKNDEPNLGLLPEEKLTSINEQWEMFITEWDRATQ